jgi:hypothetical protein
MVIARVAIGLLLMSHELRRSPRNQIVILNLRRRTSLRRRIA